MITPTDLLNIDIESLTDTDSLAAVGQLIAHVGAEAGMYSPVAGTSNRDLRTLAKRWLDEAADCLRDTTAAEALSLIMPYDILHRLAYRSPAYTGFVNSFVFKAFDAIIHGDTSVDQYTMFGTVQLGLARRDAAYFEGPLTWATVSLSRWHKQALAETDLSDHDLINRAAVLISADLWAQETDAQEGFKRAVFNRYRHYLDRLTGAPTLTLSPRDIRDLDALLSASYRYLTAEERHTMRDTLDRRISMMLKYNQLLCS